MPASHKPSAAPSTSESERIHEQPTTSNEEPDIKLAVLKTIFKHSNFRGKQEEAIDTILEGKDCLIVLPTGGGKTICYSIPVLMSGGVTVIICPLLSLMLDQVQYLRSKGLNVCYLNSSVPSEDREVIMHNLLLDVSPYSFFFVTPESATQPDMLEKFSKMKSQGTLTYFVIDECHCIDMWGYDFRPAYANLGNLSSLKCQIVALTATCTARTEQVIIKSLNLSNATIVRQTCDRPNITLLVKAKKSDGKDQIVDFILDSHNGQCGIVCCLQRSDTTDMAYFLQTRGINSTYYHGALDPHKKKENFQTWQDGKAQVMCATVAFAMGINKADVRFVIHLSISQSLECYVQEFGRASRDGEESVSFVLFRFEDWTKHL